MSQNFDSITLTAEQAATLMQVLAQVESVMKDLLLAPVQCEMTFTGTKRVEAPLEPFPATPEQAAENAPVTEDRHLRFRQRLQRHRTQRLQATRSSPGHQSKRFR